MSAKELGTILVVGGSGFVGSHIVEHLLLQDDATNIVITSRNPKSVDSNRVAYHVVDITSKESVDALFSVIKPNVVIHTATPSHLSPYPVLYATNVVGTKLLLDAAKKCRQTRAFVYTSSDSACHPSPFKQITEDECKLYNDTTFNNPYGRTKAIADKCVQDANCADLKTAVLRVGLVYGPRNSTGFVEDAVNSIRKGEYKNQVGADLKMWEVVYAGSAAHAHVLASRALLDDESGAGGQAFFISDDRTATFFDFMRKCYASVGYPVKREEIKVVPMWVVKMFASAGEWMYWVFTFGTQAPKLRRQDINHLDAGSWWNIDKARKILGYEPVLEQDEAVRRTMEWGIKTYA